MQINLIPFKPNEELLEPIPAIRGLPNWYKTLSPFRNGDKKQENNPDGPANLTLKRCNPFGDALGAGYFLLLENDFDVQRKDENANLVWTRGGQEFIAFHPKEMIAPEMIPPGYGDIVLKFNHNWALRPPKGYSLLFTHPLNRYELPFLTLSGIVDSDNYKLPVNLPFLLRNDYEGIIEAGTPIAQIIPIKRESWKSKVLEYDSKQSAKDKAEFDRKIYRVYKSLFWTKKEYK